MTFQDGLQDLVGKPVVQSKYIYGSIFHLLFSANGGEVEFVCNGCQWVIFNDVGEVLLHDEAALSTEALSGVFTVCDFGHRRFCPRALVCGSTAPFSTGSRRRPIIWTSMME